jgi:membrane protein YdbS with pleckstrin-like domain
VGAPVRPEPGRRLPPQALTLWRLEAAGFWGAAAIATLVLARAVDAPAPLGTLLWVVLPAGALAGIGLVPALRWRRWAYEVRDEEIDLRRGAFTVRRTLVPMARVQHVDTSRGVLEQSLGIATVIFHTAAGPTAIPALPVAEAEAVRDRSASLARTPDEL